MNIKAKIATSVVAMALVISVMCVGVFAALSVTVTGSGSVSFSIDDGAKVTIEILDFGYTNEDVPVPLEEHAAGMNSTVFTHKAISLGTTTSATARIGITNNSTIQSSKISVSFLSGGDYVGAIPTPSWLSLTADTASWPNPSDPDSELTPDNNPLPNQHMEIYGLQTGYLIVKIALVDGVAVTSDNDFRYQISIRPLVT